MLITARGRTGPEDDRGVVGHAWSLDLCSWELRPPLTVPGQGFGQLEVLQVEVIDGVPILLFSCLAGDMSASRRIGTTGGVWAAPAASRTGPFDLAAAREATDSSLYSGRLVRNHEGKWFMLAFEHDGPDGTFVGSITDPMPVRWDGERLVVATASSIPGAPGPV
jgi:beta-fructofuranosidase